VIKRKTEAKKNKQIADTIVGFCLDFSAMKTAKIYGYRYNDVIKIYQQIRERISEISSNEGELKGIVEADESYFGGINRKRNKKFLRGW
jgi:hypothetical protein